MLVAEEESADACSVAIVTACARRGAPDNPLIEEPTRRPSAHASADKKSVNACMGFGTLPGVRLVAIALDSRGRVQVRGGRKFRYCVARAERKQYVSGAAHAPKAAQAPLTADFLLPPELVLPPGR